MLQLPVSNNHFIFDYSELDPLTGVYWLTVAFIFPAATCFPFGLQQTVRNKSTWTGYSEPQWLRYGRTGQLNSSVKSDLLQVMPLWAGSSACILTVSVTSKIIILPSDRQAASVEAWAGFHFRSCTAVPDGTAGCSDAKGNFCGLAWKNKNKRESMGH